MEVALWEEYDLFDQLMLLEERKKKICKFQGKQVIFVIPSLSHLSDKAPSTSCSG